MALPTKYDPSSVEDKWYKYWLENSYFKATVNPEKKPFSIVIPPPNVTGVLHMGHMLNNTIQDILIRKARMEGKEACWVPGTDHASIATEAKVVRMLREKGIKKSDLSREEFLTYAWEWKEKYGGIILEQLKKLGASCDWERTSFTMDPEYYKAVIRVFVDLYKKGYIYRGLRMVNWDVEAKTAVSNEEVLYQEDGEKSKLYSISYQIKDSDEYIVIATQRPETILGDAAIAINPTDERYQHLLGKSALVPFIHRAIPIIADEYVDKDFGTGCLKVTPAHDPNDYEIGLRHKLPIIDTIALDGTLNEKCEVEKYIGKDRFIVRKMIIKDLESAGHLVGETEFITRIGRSERTNTVIEPKLSLQWFIKMKEISREAHQAVMTDEVVLYPSKFKNTYHHWMENVRDWCISRQLWWGHRIPAYYYGSGENDFVVAESLDEAIILARKVSGNLQMSGADLHQDEDVLDTWASSWLFPLAVFDGFNDQYFDKDKGKIIPGKNAELDYFYPTDTLVTAPEILFFWVARMIIAGYEYTGKKPFQNVYLTGIVRDKLRRKMSKSLGNSPDPLDLIAQYGADAVRTGMLFSSPAGNDLLFDEKLVEQGRNFANKIWNAFRLVSGWETNEVISSSSSDTLAMEWFSHTLYKSLEEIQDHFAKFRISEALMSVYKLIWDDFCSTYLEWIKPPFGEKISDETKKISVGYFEDLLKILHPFMPFISEELWQELKPRSQNESLIISPWPTSKPFDNQVIDEGQMVKAIVSELRNLRNSRGLSPKEPLKLQIASKQKYSERIETSLVKLANLSAITYQIEIPSQAVGFVIKATEYFILLPQKIDETAERDRLTKELEYYLGFKTAVEKKLSNERFVQQAPAHVVEIEKQKLADAQSKVEAITAALSRL